MKQTKDKTYAFRISSGDLEQIRARAKRSKLSVTDYLTACALKKKIVVIDGVDKLLPELKAQGRNLNQLTMLAHMGKAVYPGQVDALIEGYGKLCEAVRRVLEKF